MDDDAIRAQIEQNNALLAQAQALLAHHNEVVSQAREIMAEKLNCSQWDLEQVLLGDLTAEERESNKAAALEQLKQLVPGADEFISTPQKTTASAPTGVPAGGLRPRRRMI